MLAELTRPHAMITAPYILRQTNNELVISPSIDVTNDQIKDWFQLRTLIGARE